MAIRTVNSCCGNDGALVEHFIGTAYDVVKTVYDNLGILQYIYDFLNQHGVLVTVDSVDELKALNTDMKYARVYTYSTTAGYGYTDYLYVEGNDTGVVPNDPDATGTWVVVASSSTGGGEGGNAPAYIPYVYAQGSALGGETTIAVPSGTVGVPFIIIEGYMNTVGYGFTFNTTTLTVTLAQPLEVGDEVVLLLTGTPAVPDNPNISNWVTINWLYNGGYAVGGEQVIAIPYTFEAIPAIYKNGDRYYAGLADKSYTVDAANQRILLTEPLATNDRLIVQIGGESTTFIMSDRTVQEVARSANVHENEVILSTNTTQYLNGIKVVYDVVAQKIYGLPTLPTNVYINSVSNGQLTYSPGNITVDLLPVPDSGKELKELLLTTAGADNVITSSGASVQDFVDSSVLAFSTVAQAVAFTGFTDNQKVRTMRYNVDVVTDWVFTIAEPASPIFYIPVTSGGYLTLMTPNFASAGLISSETYNATDAWANRNLSNKLCQDTRFSHLKYGKSGTYWILGTICPNRHNFTIEIENGVDIVGRLEDPAIPASVSNNTGGMFDMTLRANYLATGDMTNTGVLYNSNIILNGSVKTVFDASHIQPHNNNCIGYYNTVDCSVVGTGGVKGSDHRGINFDGESVNARIDIAYATGTMDEPLCMGVKSNAYGIVKVGSIYNVPFGGISGLTIGVRPSGGTVDVYIGSFEYNGTVKPVLVSAYNAEEVNAYIGYANGITHALRGYETKRIKLHGGRYLNSAYMAGRAGVNTGRTEEILVEGVKILDNQVTTGVYCETNQDTFNKITIKDCDFSLCPSTFLYVRGMTTPGAAKIVTLLNNNSPTVSGWTGAYLNLLPGAITASLVTSGGTSFTYNYKQPDYNYAFITAVVTVSGVNYPVEISTLTRGQGSITLTYTAGAATLAVTVSGTTITGTVTGGTLTAVYAHN